MEVINKKLVIVVILIGILSSIFIWKNISDKETRLEEVSLKNNKVDSSMFAIMLEEIDEEGNSTYVESSDNMWPSLKYKYNTTNSGCLDENGTNIPDILSYDAKNQKAIVRTRSVAYCYLYFDIDESVYAKVRNDYTDNKGALLLSETESDEYPVYYYNGNITNNNILYANFCWKMVRTTETGGVKLIYNGVPDEAEDGTLTCDNTGEESQIGKSSFNSSDSLAYSGYMYNTVYKTSSNLYAPVTSIGGSAPMSSSTLYYYGEEAVWNEETQKYDLKLSDGTDVTETTAWSTDLVGKYTCRNTTDTSCETVYYIVGGTSTYMNVYGISNNTTKDEYKIKLATSITLNEDGTYTLVNPVEVSKAEWPTSHSNYLNYYYCSDLTSETCGTNNTIMYYSISTSTTSLTGLNRANEYKYGNSFKYENGIYKLVDTDTSSIMQFWDWKDNYNQINNNHYTCFNVSGECENIYYIYYTSATTAYYITLSDGKTVEDALNEMLYAEDVNKTDSTIKDYIDTWYEGAILDTTNANGVLYSSYLENTIWCNNRMTTNLSSSGWNPNGGNVTKALTFNSNSLKCESKTDQFTLKVESGGTEGYGNNTLDYPIGLISYKEASLSGSNSYLKSDNTYWLMGTINISNYCKGSYFHRSGEINAFELGNIKDSRAVRPSISLSMSVDIIGGNGEVDNPYQVELFN